MTVQYPTDTVVITDLGALRRNIVEIQKFVGPNTSVMAMVKANAYGHGLLDCARTAIDAGVAMLGTAFTAEGITLREAGIQIPVLVLSPESYDRIGDMLKYRLTPTVTSFSMLKEVERHIRRTGIPCSVHINVDTGMGRVGVSENNVIKLAEAVCSIPGLSLEGIYTHFPSADEEKDKYTQDQTARFLTIINTLRTKGITPPYIHASNSAGLLKYPDARFTMVRPGIMIYGLEPFPGSFDILPMEPVLSWHTTVCFLKDAPAGTKISYGGTFITQRPSILATAPVGYGDGYRRHLSNRGHAIINGTLAPIAGRICMDQTIFDVTDAETVKLGDKITLIGQNGTHRVRAEDHAEIVGTINYEIVTGIADRVSRTSIPAT